MKTTTDDAFLDDQITEQPEKTATKAPEAEKAIRSVMGGRFNKKLPAKDLPVSVRLAPPITKRQYAMYKLVQYENAKDGRVMEEKYARIEPQPSELQPHYTIDDPFEEDFTKRTKILSYVDGTERYTFTNPMTGQLQEGIRPKVISPQFINGGLLLDIKKNYLKYLWLELHPRNASNKRRDMNKPPKFRRVDLDHANPYLEVARLDLQYEAEKMVKFLTIDKLKGLAVALKLPYDMPQQALITMLRKRARETPEQVLYTAPDKKEAVKLSILEGLQQDILDYQADTLQWFFGDSTEPLFQVLIGKDPIDDLADYLLKSDQEALDELRKQLEYFRENA